MGSNPIGPVFGITLVDAAGFAEPLPASAQASRARHKLFVVSWAESPVRGPERIRFLFRTMRMWRALLRLNEEKQGEAPSPVRITLPGAEGAMERSPSICRDQAT